MQAIVLVGGEGTRLRPLTYGTPKPMVPIMNVPYLERTLVRLREAGIDDVILPAGYLPATITDYFGDGSRLGMRLRYVIEETPLGTAGAIKNVAGLIDGPFFMLNGDVLTSLDLRAMMRFHREKGGIGALHLIRVEDPSAFGCVVHDGDGLVRAFVEKPPKQEAPTDEVNAGTYLLEREILDFIPAGRPVSIERETFPAVIAAAKGLYAYTTGDYWIDLGRPEHYWGAHRDIFDARMPLELGFSDERIAGPGAGRNFEGLVRGPAFIGADVSIGHGARVGPYAVLGDGCTIGRDAVVEDSLLWDRVTVGDGARVEGAIIATGAQIGPGARVEPASVLGHDAIVAENAVVSGAVGGQIPAPR